MKKVLTLISLQYYDDAKAGIATLFITIWAKDKRFIYLISVRKMPLLKYELFVQNQFISSYK